MIYKSGVHAISIQYMWRIIVALCLYIFLQATSVAGFYTETAPDLEAIPLALTFFNGADSIGKFSGNPLSAPVYHGKRTIGYVFFTDDVIRMPAYSGKPIRTLVGFDMEGNIKGATIVKHEEPILLAGVSEQQLHDFTTQYLGIHANNRVQVGGSEREGYSMVDGISGATITVMVLNATIMKSVHEIAIVRGLIINKEESAIESYVDEPIWVYAWRERTPQIIILLSGLVILFVILILQDWLARKPTLLTYIRYGYLFFTVIFIGWYSLAQLSIVNVLTFVHSFNSGFSWENYLIDPMMFILWAFVAVTILLWGRGVYCGWLCPFGAIQELVFRIGERLHIRAYEFPEVVHERLWAIKYIILLALFGISLQSLGDAELYAEVEPFKTAFALHFQREWGYVIYAAVLILASLLNRKFYCRYLCPLGAALTFPSKFRIFDWLRRRKECGRPCQTCRKECEVGAIRLTGEINSNECHYCLDCQVTYWNEKKCPPMVDRRKRYEKHKNMAQEPHISVEIGDAKKG